MKAEKCGFTFIRHVWWHFEDIKMGTGPRKNSIWRAEEKDECCLFVGVCMEEVCCVKKGLCPVVNLSPP